VTGWAHNDALELTRGPFLGTAKSQLPWWHAPLIDLRPDVGRDVNAIVMRCLAKSPKDRYADAGGLLADLDRVQTLTAVQAAA